MAFPLADLRDLVSTLADALGPALASDDARAFSHPELVEALRAAEQFGRWADAARLLFAGEVARREAEGCGDAAITARFGCTSAAELVERATGVSPATARSRVRVAREITERLTLTGQPRPAPLPEARQAVVAGRLGVDALSTIADALRPLSEACSTSEIEAAEYELVRAAQADDDGPGCTIHELRVMATAWALFLDPDGTLPADELAERKRGLRVGRRSRHGLRHVSGDVTEDVAAQLDRLLDAHLNPRAFDRTPRFSDAASGDTVERIGDTRTIEQRRHDAFASILSAAAAAAETPSLGGSAPTLIVTTTEADLVAADGVAFIESADGPVAVSAAAARHIGCHGTVHRVLLEPNGALKLLSVRDRVFTHWQRKAIGARDGGCVIPGCTVPAAWCEVHHVVEHARGGPTDTGNGVLLCWHHHRGLEKSGWEIRMVEGMPHVRPPRWIDPQRRWRGPNRLIRHELVRARE
jgi:hypothetical protein